MINYTRSFLFIASLVLLTLMTVVAQPPGPPGPAAQQPSAATATSTANTAVSSGGNNAFSSAATYLSNSLMGVATSMTNFLGRVGQSLTVNNNQGSGQPPTIERQENPTQQANPQQQTRSSGGGLAQIGRNFVQLFNEELGGPMSLSAATGVQTPQVSQAVEQRANTDRVPRVPLAVEAGALSVSS